MKFVISIQLIFGLLFLGSFAFLDSGIISAEQKDPAYAKWGRIAMEKTKEKYPDADIIDYLHIGREQGKDYSVEKFKLWLKQDSKEFGVFVDIKFNNKTEQIIEINFKETSK